MTEWRDLSDDELHNKLVHLDLGEPPSGWEPGAVNGPEIADMLVRTRDEEETQRVIDTALDLYG